jgi:sugar phosphate isomerase/epimerase
MKIACCWMYAIGKYGFPPTLEQMLTAIREMAAMGFEYIELEAVGSENAAEEARHAERIAAACKDAGVRVSDFAAVLPELVSTDRKVQAKAFDSFTQGAEIAARLGSPFIWTDSYAAPVKFLSGSKLSDQIVFGQRYSVRVPDGFSWDRYWDHFVRAMSRCTAIAKEHGLGFLMEPRVGEVTSTSDALIRLSQAVNDDALGIIFDTAHLNAQKELLPVSVHKLARLIRYVHVADNDGRDDHHYPVGRGTIDWPEVVRNLKAIGFDGVYAVDLEKSETMESDFLETKRALERLGQGAGA